MNRLDSLMLLTKIKKNMSKLIIAPITITLKPLKPFYIRTNKTTAISKAEGNPYPEYERIRVV